jgi:hypothetical protein
MPGAETRKQKTPKEINRKRGRVREGKGERQRKMQRQTGKTTVLSSIF